MAILQPRWRIKAGITTKVKRSSAPSPRYCNSVLTFHPVLKLIHGVELNPGPKIYSTTKNSQTKKGNVTVAHLNVRSIISRENFYLVTETIKENNYDIFTISESWLGSSTSFLDIHIPGYLLFRQDRGEHKSGGGLLVYIKNIYKASTVNHLSSVSETDFQQLWIKLRCKKLKSFLLCTVYRPPSTPMSFLEH